MLQRTLLLIELFSWSMGVVPKLSVDTLKTTNFCDSGKFIGGNFPFLLLSTRKVDEINEFVGEIAGASINGCAISMGSGALWDSM